MKKLIQRIMIFCISSVVCLTGLCSCSGESINVSVFDSGVSTKVEAAVGMTVADVLSEAEIMLGSRDQVEPPELAEVSANSSVTVKRYAQVEVTYSGETKTVELVGGKVEDAVQKAGFSLEDGLKTNIIRSAYLKNGMKIRLFKGTVVNLTMDGKTSDVITEAKTVGDFLSEQKITLGDEDEMNFEPEDEIEDGMKLVIKRVTYKEETKKESIEFSKKEKYDETLADGEKKITQKGENGEKEVVYKVKYIDGKEDSREKLSEEIIKKPVDEITSYGSKDGESSSDDSDDDDDEDSESGESSGYYYDDEDSDDEASYVQPQHEEQSQQQSSYVEPEPEPEPEQQGGRTVVSKQRVDDCDGSGHGYFIITYSDGSVEYEDY